jgi:hypothetical protein
MHRIVEGISHTEIIIQIFLEASVVTHACNPSLRRLRQEDWEFKTSQCYKVRPCLKTNKDILINCDVMAYLLLYILHNKI